MHILEVIDGLTAGGAEKMVVTLSHLCVERGITVSVVSFDADWDAPYAVEIRKLGIPVHHLMGGLFNLSRIEQLLKVIDATQADLIHSYLTYANIIGTISARIARVPVIASLHSVSMEPYHPVRTLIETWLMRNCSSEVMAAGYSIAEAHQKRLGRKKIKVIQNAVPLSPALTIQEKNDIRKELVVDPDKTILISVGRLAPPKGFDTLVEAFSIIHSLYPNTALAIIGEGELRAEIENVISNYGLVDSVFLNGERDDIPRILPAADIYINSSLWEGMSVSILEAMAAGLPIVATRVGDATWMVRDNVGILVEPRNSQALSDAVILLLNNNVLRQEFGRNSRKRIEEEYSVNHWFEQIMNLYSETNPSIRVSNA